MDTEQERQFYRLAAQRAFDPERFERMNENAKKTAEKRNETKRETWRKYMVKYYHSEKGQLRYRRQMERIHSDPVLREKIRKKQREYHRRKYSENPEYYNSRAKKYHETHRDRINERMREKRRNMTPEQREKVKAQVHEYYMRYREKILARQKELREKRKAENGKQD